ncbi:MAG: hypothetical protein LBK52_05835 [Deltaproteobacteria bacterium]|jgi:hypothetical protein|nr:hypothetical protein [Deltaproteobacteria bacterium]
MPEHYKTDCRRLTPADTASRRQRPGLVMVFVIVVMMVTSLMGLIILSRIRSEVVTTGQSTQSFHAFNSADSAAKMTNLFTRVLLHPVLGTPQDLVNSAAGPALPMTIEFNNTRFTWEKLVDESVPIEYIQRYLQTGIVKTSSASNPHIVFKINDEEVAAAVITLDRSLTIPPGFSLSAVDQYDESAGPSLPVDMVVSIRGSTPGMAAMEYVAPQSMITTIMRELL